jgi:hypothetical protein
MVAKTKQQLEQELSKLTLERSDLEIEVAMLKSSISDAEIQKQLNRALQLKTILMIAFMAAFSALIVLIDFVCSYLRIESPVAHLQGWSTLFLAIVVLVGYLTQVAMMLNRKFRISTNASGTGAEIHASVGDSPTPKRARSSRS